MRAVLEQLEVRRAQARMGGGQKRVDAQHAKGKLTARERLVVLLDEGSFEEYDMYVTHRGTDFGMAEQKVAGDGVVTGWERSMAGLFTYSLRISRCLADRCRRHTPRRSARSWKWRCAMAPVIGLNDSGGARI